MNSRKLFPLLVIAASLMVTLLLAAPVSAGGPQNLESPPEGIPPSVFATEFQGCLGPLRSFIAQGQADGFGPFGKHFTGDVNPGVHQGTVGEEEFLGSIEGVGDIGAFCGSFE